MIPHSSALTSASALAVQSRTSSMLATAAVAVLLFSHESRKHATAAPRDTPAAPVTAAPQIQLLSVISVPDWHPSDNHATRQHAHPAVGWPGGISPPGSHRIPA